MNSSSRSPVPAIGRLLISIIFLVSGFSKLAAPAGTKAYIVAAGLPLPDLAYLIAVIVELGFGLALLLGYRTRFVALVIAVYTLATALCFHLHPGDHNQMINFMKNLAMAGGLLQIFIFGAGAFSLDALAGSRKTTG